MLSLFIDSGIFRRRTQAREKSTSSTIRFNHLNSTCAISFGTNLNKRWIRNRSSSIHHMSYVQQKQTAQFYSTMKCTITCTNSKRLNRFWYIKRHGSSFHRFTFVPEFKSVISVCSWMNWCQNLGSYQSMTHKTAMDWNRNCSQSLKLQD